MMGLLFMVPWRLYEVHRFMDRHLGQIPKIEHPERTIIWVRPWEGFYAQDLVQNQPTLDRGPVMFVSRGPKGESSFMSREFPDARPIGRQGAGVVWESPIPVTDRASELRKGSKP